MTAEYDRLAGEYGKQRTIHEGVLRALVEGGGLGKDSRVLEIGTGTANYLAAIHELLGCHCSGVDPSVAMLEIADNRAPDVEFMVGRAEELPITPASFDFAFCVDVIHHVTDRQGLITEAFRVLDEHGTLCIVTQSEEDIRTRLPHSKYFPETIALDLARYPRLDDLERWASSAGFRGSRRTTVHLDIPILSAEKYETKAFSSLRAISQEGFEAGLRQLKADLALGPLKVSSDYTLLWATK
jgi:ubiquinone/menaquinone biosynthesis C-methylase UbiE